MAKKVKGTIVKFDNGEYGVRKGRGTWFSPYCYLDIYDLRNYKQYNWRTIKYGQSLPPYGCLTGRLSNCEEAINGKAPSNKDFGTPVEVNRNDN